ncbi:hypothetical protein [Telluribacter humicola]|uniref:hypothetical protein n=1 Tax=Telluribacter humicola TaxID=1720261 RepID=UPI001A978B90|nr:hypothetical protein [Telluribacter humicola]
MNTNNTVSGTSSHNRLRTPEQIIEAFLSEGHDPVMLERHLNEMMIHFMRPIGDHRVSPPYADSVYGSYLGLRELIKNLGTYQKQCQVYDSSLDMPAHIRQTHGIQ